MLLGVGELLWYAPCYLTGFTTVVLNMKIPFKINYSLQMPDGVQLLHAVYTFERMNPVKGVYSLCTIFCSLVATNSNLLTPSFAKKQNIDLKEW